MKQSQHTRAVLAETLPGRRAAMGQCLAAQPRGDGPGASEDAAPASARGVCPAAVRDAGISRVAQDLRTSSPMQTILHDAANADNNESREPTGCVMPRLSVGGARRSSLWRRLRPRAPALALLALAALALGGILAPEAEAQTETEVWSGTVTVGAVSGTHGRGYLASAHPLALSDGALSDDDFDIGGTTYTVWRITIATNNTPHRPRFVVATGSTPAVVDLPDKDELILRVTYGGEAGDFTLSDATYTDSSGTAALQGFHWSSSFGHPSGISPTIGGTMTVALLRTSTNTAPTVVNAISDQTATVGTVFNYEFPANTFNDADSDTLTYTATKPDNSALPSWLSFDGATRTFSGTPATADVGTVTVKVTASDGGNDGSVSDTFDIVVSADTTVSPEVWSTTMTVGGLSSGAHAGYVHSSDANNLAGVAGGSLADDDFDIGGTTYTVWQLYNSTQDDRLHFRIVTGSPAAGTELPDVDELTLQLQSSTDAADFSTYSYPLQSASWDATNQQFPLAGPVVASGGQEPLGSGWSERSGKRHPRSVALR